jgi:hypothetical protein
MGATRNKRQRLAPTGSRRHPKHGRAGRPTAHARAPPSADGKARHTALIVIPVALCLLLGTLVVVGFQSRPHLAGQNGVLPLQTLFQSDATSGAFCQDDEVLPKDTASIELSLDAVSGLGPRVRASVSKGGRTLARGVRSAGWSGQTVRIPVRSVPRTIAGARVCVTVAGEESAAFTGTKAGTQAFDGSLRTTQDRIAITYHRAGSESWWSLAGTIVHRMGLGRALHGAWIAFLAAALMTAAVGVALAQLIREQRRPTPEEHKPAAPDRSGVRAIVQRIPTAAYVCALVALLSSAAWTVITPPFQAPDEVDHFAYVQVLAETGHPPDRGDFGYSREERQALQHERFTEHVGRSHVGLWSSIEQARLERALGSDPARIGSGGAGTASSQPPLFYALEAVPYRLAHGASLLWRLALMRLLCALLAGITALFVYLFVREALPGIPWAWSVAGLATALQPLLGFASGGVNPDALLFASSAALFYCLARGFRRGLGPTLAATIGALIAVGFLTKLTFVGLLPGILIALLIMAWREEPASKLAALRLPALAIGVALVPIGLVALLELAVWDRDTTATLSGDATGSAIGGGDGGIWTGLNYVWQWYLPQLPGTTDLMPGAWPTRDYWLMSFLGRFGYAGVGHPPWVRDIALGFSAIGLGLCLAALAQARKTVRQRGLELASYASIVLGLAGGIGAASYAAAKTQGPLFLAHGRYFLPLAALMAAAVALAARAGGPRWGRPIGAVIVVLVIGQAIGGQLLIISHNYA